MNGRALKVLLIDDDEDDYVVTRDMLAEIEGVVFHLDWVRTYDAARGAVGRADHDVYLLDYRLGERTGLELLRETISDRRRAPMILLTGQGDREVDFEAMRAGAADYLVKGQLDASTLGRAIRYAVGRAETLGALRTSEERYHRLVELSPDAIILHAEGHIIFINSAGVRLLGGESAEQFVSWPVMRFVHRDSLENVRRRIKQITEEKISVPFIEEKFIRLDGTEVEVEVAAVPFTYHDKSAVQVVARDITARKKVEAKLLHDAFHDALTGLPNRALFMEHLKLAVERAKRPPQQLFAVLFLDLDRFKNINDSLGHPIGDKLLIAIAGRLETCLRHFDTVARFGGDEFAILLNGVDDASDAVRVAERLQESLKKPFSLGGHDVFSTASIGIALCSPDYYQPEDVVRDADTAMYRAKALGKARHEVFDVEMHARAVALLQLENDLRRAVERAEFCVFYQPIVRIATGEICGFEALVRWHHPEYGLITPGRFIPVAEETGMIVAIDRWVLRKACAQMKRWQKLFPDLAPLNLSVNLSGKQFTQPDLIDYVQQILAETFFDARQLTLEITESAVIQNIEAVTGMLVQLCDLGIKLSMDDFGTGYSSLSCLHRFPIHTLKIDRSFISQDCARDETEIVRTIIMLTENMNMSAVAEGVETEEQLRHLTELRCEFAQGFYFSHPLPAIKVEHLLARGSDDGRATFAPPTMLRDPALALIGD
ncbi:MAG TPA: EAL domain-containing protein [Pyrinomonadaceae bacterium]|nr:EAL domain-containing protein [Pyrinomonadaceae bacterium]